MAIKIPSPSIIESAGNKPKIIEEYIGNVNSNTKEVSIAKMTSPGGWIEPGQKPQFNEYTLVLKGNLKATTKDEVYELTAGEAFIAQAGEWVQYSTPDPAGAEYIAVCLPAFSMGLVQRD